jgi:hypothetical protein
MDQVNLEQFVTLFRSINKYDIDNVMLNEEIIGTGKVVHKGKSLIISSGEVKNLKGELIALGQGTFNTYPFNKKDFLHEFSTPR